MAKNVDLQERLNMRFLTMAYKEKQEVYGTSNESADTGNNALDILNMPDAVLEELLELTEPMMDLVDYLNKHRNPDNKTLCRMMTASKNVFRVVDLLREVPPFAGQDFTWLDENLPKVFAPERVRKAYTERKKEQGELFIQAMCLVAQLGFGIRDFRKALIPLVESLEDEDMYFNAQKLYGVRFIRGRLCEAAEKMDKSVVLKVEDTLAGQTMNLSVDMLVLMAGMRPASDTARIATMLGLHCGKEGFLTPVDIFSRSNETEVDGVFLAGTCTGPKTIPQTIADARSAAIRIDEYLKKRKK